MSDVKISSLSYVNKDFPSLYPDLLNLATQLTNRWDPTHSNESDPGVVLLKEAAFMGDHLNFNIDKNILENFLPSATQDKSVRNISEMNGYTPRYYVAATGNVSFKWNTPEGSSVSNNFIIKPFTLVITDSDNKITYTQLDQLTFIEGKATGKFIQGTLQDLTVNNSTNIQLSNLTNGNRIYLPQTMVAQNGIYVRHYSDSEYGDHGYWVKENYLLIKPSGSFIYKVDYDSDKGLPYIEFPDDISSLIGEGLKISYISTSGASGNVSANTLVNISSPTQFVAVNEDVERLTENLNLTNQSSILNGKDPETIDEMYQSFKRVVGTFDTLVSCKDYSNAIYNMMNSDDTNLVSNCYVTDRRTDYNKALNVITTDQEGEYFKNISIKPCALNYAGVSSSIPTPEEGSVGDMKSYIVVDSEGTIQESHLYVKISNYEWKSYQSINLNDFAILTQAMTPYDIVIYALKAFSLADYNKNNPGYALSKSFTPINSDSDLMNNIKSAIEDNKCLSHTYNLPDSNDIYCFKNYLPLYCTIIPFTELGETDKSSVLDNVYRAISEAFNPRMIEFGKELNYDQICKTIIDSDDRIKDVYLRPLTYELYETSYNEGAWSDRPISMTHFIDLISKNILAGRVCMFDFDSRFNYDYGQSIEYMGSITGGVFEDIKTISSELPLPVQESSETVRVSFNNVTNRVYTYESFGTSEGGNINYEFNCPNFRSSGSLLDLTRLSSYQLVGDDKFTIKINDEDRVYQSDVTTTYVIVNNLDESSNLDKIVNGQGVRELLSSGTISVKEFSYQLSTNDETLNVDYTLNKNEFFQVIYPNYYSDKTYGVYVNYRYEYTGLDPNHKIPAGCDYVLSADEILIFQYTTDGVVKTDTYGNGTVINSSNDLIPTDLITSALSRKDWQDKNGILYTSEFSTLSSNQTISTRLRMNTILNSTNMQCYWILKNTNILFGISDYSRILGTDEYFMYTDQGHNEIIILGAGTMLTRDSAGSILEISSSDVTIESITENGLNANIPWKSIDFSSNNLTISEMKVVTLGEGDRFYICGWTPETSEGLPAYVDNTWRSCNGIIWYKQNGTETTINIGRSNEYFIRTRLDVICSKNNPQQLTDGEHITITYGSSSSKEFVYPTNIQSTLDLNLMGDDNIDVSGHELDIYGYTVSEDLPPKAFVIDGSGDYEYPFYYKVKPSTSESTGGFYLLPIFISNNEVPVKSYIYYKTGSTKNYVSFKDYNGESAIDIGSGKYELILKGNEVYNLTITDTSQNNKEMYLELVFDAGSEGTVNPELVTIKEIKVVDSFNTGLSSLVTLEQINNRISSIISNSDHPSLKPYYTYDPSDDIRMYDTNFDDPISMWDVNNVANMMTIPQIDLNNSEFLISLRG